MELVEGWVAKYANQGVWFWHTPQTPVASGPYGHPLYCLISLLKMGRYCSTVNVSLLGHVSKLVSILLSKLGHCPNTDTSLCYCNYPFLTVCIIHSELRLISMCECQV